MKWLFKNGRKILSTFAVSDLLKLYANKAAIESEMGVQLEWNELPEKKASRIMVYKTVDFDNKDDWPAQFDWMMDMAVKMKKAFKKYL